MLSIAPLDDSFDPPPALVVNTEIKPEYHPTVHDIAPDDRPSLSRTHVNIVVICGELLFQNLL